jgi:long-chain acyl-CoA synthetase
MITYPAGIKGPELISAMKERAVTILVAVPQLLELIRNGIMRRFSDMPSVVSFVLHLLLTVSGRVRRISGINIGKVLLRSAHKAFGEGFRFFASGGARLDPTVMEDLEAIGFTVLEGYGLTETSPVVTFNPIKKRKPGSVGKPLPSVEIKVADPSAAGEGEIAIRGPMVMQGYYRNPEETDKVIRDGWFLSGDLGYRDYEGYLFLTGRAKEVIVLSSGKNVYPEDLEREYLKIPLIKEICVTGIEERGVTQSLHGIIVPNLDHARKEKIGNVRDALRWDINRLSLTLPSYMRLKGFTVYADPLPRTRLGKLQRYMIKDLISLARGERREPREEDKVLLTDEAGRAVAECITPLLRESLPLHVTDNLELDLGLDSLQRIELVVAMEKSLSLRLPETFASDIQTVGELIAKVKEFRSRAALETEKPVMEDLSGEPSEEDIKRIGLRQGLIEWAITAVLLRVIRGILSVFFRLEVRGIENLPEPPFIIASNHCSNMDGFVIGSAVPLKLFRIMSFQGFQTYFSGWWLPSLFGRLAHAIPIDPETFLSKALRLSSYVLRKNRILCIFPEGGRSFDGTVMRFKKGIGILALQQNVPAVPALIEGTSEALPPGALWPKSKAITLSFGKPLYPKELNSLQKPEDIDEYQFFADAIRERVRMLRGDNLGT